MAYGTYSEIYYAVSLTNTKVFKIGETTNARRRERTLWKAERMYIPYSCEVGGDEATRLFIESYLRLKISQLSFVSRDRLDYFVCDEEKDIEILKDLFKVYLEEALKII